MSLARAAEVLGLQQPRARQFSRMREVLVGIGYVAARHGQVN